MLADLVHLQLRIAQLRREGRETVSLQCSYRLELLEFLTPDWAVENLDRLVRLVAWWRTTLAGWRP